jgi:hypothetical protein
MRTFLIVAAFVAAAAPANGATRNFGITSFTKVRVDGPFAVALRTGIAPFARASGSSAALDRVAIEVRGDTLVIHNNLDSWGGYPGKDPGPVKISLGTHDLSQVWVNGSGSLSIDRVKGLAFGLSLQGSGSAEIEEADVDQLNASVAGTASAMLRGKAARLTAVVRGISSLDAAKLTTKDAVIGAEGAAKVTAEISDSATIDASGPATIALAGHPACTLRINGSAGVSGCR